MAQVRMDFGDLEQTVKTLLAAPQQLQAMADAAHAALSDRSDTAAFAADVAAMLHQIDPPSHPSSRRR